MANGGGFGRLLLYAVLGLVVLIVAGKIAGMLLGALWNLLLFTLVAGAIVGVTLMVVRAVRRPIGGGGRPRLPR